MVVINQSLEIIRWSGESISSEDAEDIVVRVKTVEHVIHEMAAHHFVSMHPEPSPPDVLYEDGLMEFVRPSWANDNEEGFEIWRNHMEDAETDYAYMVAGLGMEQQQARMIMPASVASTICIKKSLHDWREIFSFALNIAPSVYPKMRALIIAILMEFHKRSQEMFADLVKLVDPDIRPMVLVDSVSN